MVEADVEATLNELLVANRVALNRDDDLGAPFLDGDELKLVDKLLDGSVVELIAPQLCAYGECLVLILYVSVGARGVEKHVFR